MSSENTSREFIARVFHTCNNWLSDETHVAACSLPRIETLCSANYQGGRGLDADGCNTVNSRKGEESPWFDLLQDDGVGISGLALTDGDRCPIISLIRTCQKSPPPIGAVEPLRFPLNMFLNEPNDLGSLQQTHRFPMVSLNA